MSYDHARERNIRLAGPPAEPEPVTDAEAAPEPSGGGALEELDRAYAGIRERLASAIADAEAAAERIVASARADAAEIARRATDEAEAQAQGVFAEAEQVRAEAEEYARDLRLAVDAYATRQRREAEEEARNTVTRAEARARATREAAEEAAREVERVAQRRQEDMLAEARLLEERRRRVLESLRDVALQLEQVPVTDGDADDARGGAPRRPRTPRRR